MDAVEAAGPAVAVVAGTILLSAGLWMLHARRPPRDALIALSAGVLLFAFALVPRSPPPSPENAELEPITLASAPVVLSRDGTQTTVSEPAPTKSPPPEGRPAARLEIEASEAEPNDTFAGANIVPLGVAIEGSLTEGDLDHFSVEVPPGAQGEIVANVTAFGQSVDLVLYDDAGQALGTARTFAELDIRTSFVGRKADRPRYDVLVAAAPGTADVRYQLTIALRPR